MFASGLINSGNSGALNLVGLSEGGQPRTAALLAVQKQASSPQTLARIDQTASDFEAVFLSQMLEESMRGVSSNPMSGEDEKGGFADDTFRSMMNQEYGKLMANAGGIGLAQHIKQSMLSMQEVSHAAR